MEPQGGRKPVIPITQRPQFQPVVLSLAAHVVLILLAMWIHMSEPFAAPVDELLHFNVNSVDSRPLLLKHTSEATNPDSKIASRRFKRMGEDRSALPKDVPMDSLAAPVSIQKKEEAIVPKRLELEEPDEDKKSEMQELLTATESAHLQDTVQVHRKSTTGVSDVFQMVDQHKANAARLIQSLAKPLKNIGLGSHGNINIDPDEGMPGFTPLEGTLGNSAYDQGGAGESKGEILKYESLDDFLDIQVSTYQEPPSGGGSPPASWRAGASGGKDAQKYFMIKIFAKKNAKALKVMPKEILFTIDCSLSISPERLDEFKRGISNCLKDLNKQDVFNIVAFKDKTQLFRPASVSATPQLIKEAERFVSELTSNRTTDVYNAFEKIVKSPLGRKPSNIILISDGRPTNGIVDSRELINSVTRLNKKVRPIFAYSGGAKVNRYLLDFMSYQNRAWSQFIKERGKIDKGLSDFYAKIKDPVFLNLRYQLNGLSSDNVFPKTLPDFYRNAEFTIYGQYDKENEFSMQLLGDIEGQTKELIFSRSLTGAEKGGPEIMKGFAFNRIYYLISEMTTKGQDPRTLKEIQSLSQRYGVTTPYSTDLKESD